MDKNKKRLICSIATTGILLTQAYTINTNINTNLITKVYANDYYTHDDLVVLEIDDDYSVSSISTYNDGLFIIRNKDYKYGIMDMAGNIILEPEYKLINDFIDGVAVIIKEDNNGTRYFSLVNTSGEFLTSFTEIENFNNFSESLLAIQKNNKYGFIDNTGTEVIPFDYRLVTDFSSGLAKVWTDDKSYFIDKDNNIVLDVESKYASVGNAFYGGLLTVKNENNKWGFIDTSGFEVTSFIYDEFINSSQYGLRAVKRAGKWGFIDETGIEVIPCIYDSVNDFIEDFCYATKDNNEYLIDTSGNIMLSSSDVPYPFPTGGIYDGLIRFIDKSVNKKGYYDINGNIIIPAIYDLGSNFSNGFTVVKKDDKEYIIKNPLYGNIDDSDDVEPEQEESINPNLTAINGLSGVYIMPTSYNSTYHIVDKDGNQLVDEEFREVATELGIGDTLAVRYTAGMTDSRAGLLDKDLNIIVPDNGVYYSIEFVKSGGVYYVKAVGSITDYYDLKGNKLDYEPVEDIINPDLTAINGLTGVYIMPSGYGNSYYIVDKDSNKLVDEEFREVTTELGTGDTLEVRYTAGMTDSRAGLLDKDLNIIVPDNGVYYSIEFVKSGGVYYVKAVGSITDYYDLKGNKLDYEPVEDIINPDLTAINGLTGVYIMPSGSGNSYYIVDKDSNKLVDKEFREVATELGIEDTLTVRYIAGMGDSCAGLLDKELNIIVPSEALYFNIEFIKSSGVYYIKATGWSTGYYDLSGNKLDYEPVEDIINPDLTAISGLNGVYVMPTSYNSTYHIVDKDGNQLVDEVFREVATELGIGDTLEVRYIAGMADSRAGLLDKDLNIIVPNNGVYYSIEFVKSGGVYYVKATGMETHYYDLSGNKLDYEPVEDILNPDLIAISGLNGVYVMPSGSGNSYYIVDESSNKLIDIEFREVATQLGVKDTLEVRYIAGMTDSRAGLLDKELNIIVPNNGVYYSIQFVKSNGVDYVKATGSATDYYDLSGAKLEYELVEDIALLDTSYSWWAKDDVLEAYDLNLVPADLLANFTDKITRQEFCHLALQTYFAKTGGNIDDNIQTPFTDVDDIFVTTAYNLGIVSGHGNGLFKPNDLITRQESAVMVNNLANALNLTSNSENRSFVDTSYFADWATDAIYSVSSMHLSDGIFVMTGTGEGKFSPWFNYDREQAIITMLRIFNYK